jgi:hypothetical protein
METFEILFTDREDVAIAVIKGYFNADAGEMLSERVDRLGLKGVVKLVVDFTQCTLLNSPGVTSMVDIALKISEDFEGRIALVGLDNLKLQVLKTVHVIPPAEVALTLDEAFHMVSQE